MKLNVKGMTLAVAMVTPVLWVLCSALVSIAPEFAMTITGHMLHADLSDLSWSLTWKGALIGLVAWTVSTTIPAWLIAWTYNRLGRPTAS